MWAEILIYIEQGWLKCVITRQRPGRWARRKCRCFPIGSFFPQIVGSTAFPSAPLRWRSLDVKSLTSWIFPLVAAILRTSSKQVLFSSSHIANNMRITVFILSFTSMLVMPSLASFPFVCSNVRCIRWYGEYVSPIPCLVRNIVAF